MCITVFKIAKTFHNVTVIVTVVFHQINATLVLKLLSNVLILRGQQIHTVIQAVHSLLYIVAKCNLFSVVTYKYTLFYYTPNCQVVFYQFPKK